MHEAIINGIFALLGSLLTFLGTYLVNLNIKRDERNRKRIKNYLEEIKSFYNLEQLYMDAVSELRQKLPEVEGSKARQGIQKEFRNRNEENGNIGLSMTAKQVNKLLANME
ncbi:hypothetical protein [Treponema sp. Marseille-Q4130]|uniref:hypothetical protein n=1 Tax=Treponema sp. Marseille-Q4130 TaxID=2766702 RepID=UPI001651C4A0|nr:hypothetical protein [Treponema sp. Marseille-Q4130]MBC6720695.1 hypothetical protein [Treponema sp. Marseille-Q4130]